MIILQPKMTRKKRCGLCDKLIGPQGFKKHEDACLRKQQVKKLDSFRDEEKEISKKEKRFSFVLVLSKTEGLLTNGSNYTPVKLVHVK